MKRARSSLLTSAVAILCVVLLGSGTALGGRSGTTTAARSRPTSNDWCKPLRVFPPAPHLHPLTASAAQLRASGFPSRPPASDRKAFARWQAVVSHAKHYETPHPICGITSHTSYYWGFWAGHVVPRSDYGGSYITQVESEWVQPKVNGDANYTNYQDAPDTSYWAGMGASDLIQAGADSINTSTPQYRFWTEDWPAQNTIWEGPVIRPTDTAYVDVTYDGNNQATYFLENMTTGAYQSFTNAAPDVGNGYADYINERVNNLYLPETGSVYVSDNYFWQANGSFNQLTPGRDDVIVMTSNCTSSGTVLSQPGNLASDGSFYQQWENRKPYSDCTGGGP